MQRFCLAQMGALAFAFSSCGGDDPAIAHDPTDTTPGVSDGTGADASGHEDAGGSTGDGGGGSVTGGEDGGEGGGDDDPALLRPFGSGERLHARVHRSATNVERLTGCTERSRHEGDRLYVLTQVRPLAELAALETVTH